MRATILEDGYIRLTKDVLEALEKSADRRGIIGCPRYIGWDVENNCLILWPCSTQNHFSVSLCVSGIREAIHFRSRRLPKIIGTGEKEVKVI